MCDEKLFQSRNGIFLYSAISNLRYSWTELLENWQMRGLRARMGNSSFYFKFRLNRVNVERATEIQATSTSAFVLHDKTLKKETVRHTCRGVESLLFRPRTPWMNKPQWMNSFSSLPIFCWLCLIRVWTSLLLTRALKRKFLQVLCCWPSVLDRYYELSDYSLS